MSSALKLYREDSVHFRASGALRTGNRMVQLRNLRNLSFCDGVNNGACR